MLLLQVGLLRPYSDYQGPQAQEKSSQTFSV